MTEPLSDHSPRAVPHHTVPRGAGSPWARLGRAILRRLPLVGTVLGLALGVWLVATNDLGAVADTFGRIGVVGLVGIVLVRMVILVSCGFAWRQVITGLGHAGTGAFVVLRFVREGINVLLPVASVGGDVVGGRLLTFWGVAGSLAAASILVDMLFQAGTQAIFALLGVGLLMGVGGEAAAALSGWALRALLVTLVVLAAFLAFQRSPAIRTAGRRLAAWGRRLVGGPSLADPSAPASASGVYDALDAIWATGRRRALASSVLLHLGAWIFGALEIWIALACIGVEGIGFTEVVVIEALSQAIKSAAFPVPSGLGVQEGGFVLLGGLFGLDAGTALALSLVKRVPDVVLGLPALLVWQSLEARRGTVLPPQG